MRAEEKGTPRLFGTDGIRGRAGDYPLDRPTVTALGRQLATLLHRGVEAPSVVLGGDTRESTPQLCGWLAAGLTAGGAVVHPAGVVPTPAVSRLVRELGAAAGVAVSASHNPHPDNGIKIVDAAGHKWAPEAEVELEERLAGDAGGEAAETDLTPDPELGRRYLHSLADTIRGERPLAGLRVVLDAANGAAAPHAGPLFERLGAEVTVLFDRPDGRNVNAGCGSTAPEAMARATVEAGAHLGIAFDGDADRAILADETGQIRDGDAILYLWARFLKEAGRLVPPRIVATSMSNLGLERALGREGIEVVRCGVGDREVVETMRRAGILLGGEQSGHIVHLGLTPTGDGLLTGLQISRVLARSGRPMSDLLAGFHRYPQVLRNVRVARKPDLQSLPRVAAAARSVAERLGDDGRLVLRYSGTEPLARVMIEGRDLGEVEALAAELAETIQEEIGA